METIWARQIEKMSNQKTPSIKLLKLDVLYIYAAFEYHLCISSSLFTLMFQLLAISFITDLHSVSQWLTMNSIHWTHTIIPRIYECDKYILLSLSCSKCIIYKSTKLIISVRYFLFIFFITQQFWRCSCIWCDSIIEALYSI